MFTAGSNIASITPWAVLILIVAGWLPNKLWRNAAGGYVLAYVAHYLWYSQVALA